MSEETPPVKGVAWKSCPLWSNPRVSRELFRSAGSISTLGALIRKVSVDFIQREGFVVNSLLFRIPSYDSE